MTTLPRCLRLKFSGFSVGLPCSGLVSAEVEVRIVFNVTSSTGNTTFIEIRRRKACFVGKWWYSNKEL